MAALGPSASLVSAPRALAVAPVRVAAPSAAARLVQRLADADAGPEREGRPCAWARRAQRRAWRSTSRMRMRGPSLR